MGMVGPPACIKQLGRSRCVQGQQSGTYSMHHTHNSWHCQRTRLLWGRSAVHLACKATAYATSLPQQMQQRIGMVLVSLASSHSSHQKQVGTWMSRGAATM